MSSSAAAWTYLEELKHVDSVVYILPNSRGSLIVRPARLPARAARPARAMVPAARIHATTQ
jgi:hypothetical protein